MELNQLLKIIRKEKLPVNLYHSHEIQEYEVVLERKQKKYIVYVTNERAGQQGVASIFDNEDEAFADILIKSRILKKRYKLELQ